VASWSADRLDIVGRTADGNVIYKYFDEQAGKWWPSIDEWANLGSKATGPEGDPVIVTTDTNRLAIFVLADDGNLYVRVRDQ
jgi:hypothetical protein